MQIFLRSNTGLTAHNIEENTTVSEFEAKISSFYNFGFRLPQESDVLVSRLYPANSVVNVPIPILGGGKDLTEEDQNLALSYLKVKICRVCYSKNALNATVCRKKMCGHSKNLRMKKLGAAKKA